MSTGAMQAPEKKAGYLILRLTPGQGFLIERKPCCSCQSAGAQVEVRIAARQPFGSQDVQLAIMAPKEILIKRID